MNAEIIFVGGKPSNKKSIKQLMTSLTSGGAEVTYESEVEASAMEVKKALKAAAERSQMIVLMGGMGVEGGDLTVKSVCDAVGVDTICDQKVLASIADSYAADGQELPDGAFRAALVPKDARVFEGAKGNVGCAITKGEQCIVMLPNDEDSVAAVLKNGFDSFVSSMGGTASYSRTFYGVDVSAQAEQELFDDIAGQAGATLLIDRHDGEMTVVLCTTGATEKEAKDKNMSLAIKVRSILGDSIYTEDEKAIETITVGLLRDGGKTVATAESCTAGLLSKRLTDVSGSSDVFSMGIAAYSAEIKVRVLGVPMSVIESKGTVSREVSEAMASNVRRLSGCTYGVGITGVAGDSVEEKPSGLVYISLTDGNTMWTKKLNVDVNGDDARATVRNTAATIALDMLRRDLLGVAEQGKPVEARGKATSSGLTFAESGVKTATEEGVSDDGIILPADEVYFSYKEVDEAVAAQTQTTQEDENNQLYFDVAAEEPKAEENFVIADLPQESALDFNFASEPVVESPAPVESFSEVATNFMDEDFVLKEDAVIEEEPTKAPEKKKATFIDWLKNFIPWKGDSFSKVLNKSLFIVIIISLVISSCYVGDFMIKYFQNKSVVEEARKKYDRNNDNFNEETGVYDRFELLIEQNSDCIGWITVPNTNVDNPVYQTNNNDFYLLNNSIKEKSVYGAIFADYRDIISPKGNSKNVTLYGHHMKDGSMFAQLHRYKSVNFYKENPVITFDTIYGTGGNYKVIACMITNSDSMDDNGYFFDFAAPSFRSDADFMNWIEQIRRRSLYDTDVDVVASDHILTLSTCTYEVKDKELLCVVVARKVRDGESISVNTGEATTNNKVIYPQAWYDHFGGVKPTYADGVYTWVSGDYDRQDVNAPESIAPESVVSDPTSSGTSSTNSAPTSSGTPSAPGSTEPSSTAPESVVSDPTSSGTPSAPDSTEPSSTAPDVPSLSTPSTNPNIPVPPTQSETQ